MPSTSRSALLSRAERSAAAGNWPPLNRSPNRLSRARAGNTARFSRNRPGDRAGQRGQRAGFGSWITRNRRLAVALLLCVAAGIAVHQLTPASEQRVSVVVAARDLPTGTSLTESDLTSVGVPPDLALSGALNSIGTLVGRQLASPLGKGQIPTESSLLGPGLLTGAPVGTAAVPLRMADPSSIQLLSPGQLVTVVLTAAGSYDESRQSQVLAGPVPVLWTSAQGGKPGEWLGTGDTDGLVVVAADPQQAEKLAGASTQGKLFFVLVSPS
ncbi:Flp pilus assembly protein CpaB [Paenarthrobacter aurescens]|uniref:Flp pilus assembly protein CpaB family n=1 Tax=Paenarthrobacter aurescens (strain TC1) TaxID=290340 RepID=A1R8K2_PAEAT|nr:Flp pilus assembly protein CpaB [Paenarthrobacter aurescens]ABM07484.1 putative Flp pilus assembly protein CpaB family [Paenarthrobacter aurescens TC1]